MGTRKKKPDKPNWRDNTKEKPPGDHLVVGVYKYFTEDEDWEWDFKFMYYDEREFWVDDDMRMTPAPLYWFLVVPPDE